MRVSTGLSETESRVIAATTASPFATGREIASRTGLSAEAVSRIQHRVADRAHMTPPVDAVAEKQRRAAELALDRLIEALSGKAPQRNARSWPAIQLKYVELALKLVGSQSAPQTSDPAVIVQNIRAMVFGQGAPTTTKQITAGSGDDGDGGEVGAEAGGGQDDDQAGQEPDVNDAYEA